MIRVVPTAVLAAGCALLLTACPGAIDPTLTAIQEEVFGPSCAQGGCHAGSDPAADLDLRSAEAAYEGLVDVDASEVDGIRVIPGDPEASVLYQLLLDPAGESRRMPVGRRLDDQEIRAVRDWIGDGAEPE